MAWISSAMNCQRYMCIKRAIGPCCCTMGVLLFVYTSSVCWYRGIVPTGIVTEEEVDARLEGGEIGQY